MHTARHISQVSGYDVFSDAISDIFQNEKLPRGRIVHGLLQHIEKKGYTQLGRELLLGFAVSGINRIYAGTSGPKYVIDAFVKDDLPPLYEPWVRIEIDSNDPKNVHVMGGPFEYWALDDCGSRSGWELPPVARQVCTEENLIRLNDRLGAAERVVLIPRQILPVENRAQAEQRLELYPPQLLARSLPVLKELYLSRQDRHVVP